MADDLLEFGTIDVYYIVWLKNNTKYYLLDMSEDILMIKWTREKAAAFYFFTEKEASKHASVIKTKRPGVCVVAGEIDALGDLGF